jgi:hypothetical protein
MSAYADRARPFIWPIFLPVIGLLIGAITGWAVGVHAVQATVKALSERDQFVCGTGLVFLPFGYALFGMLIGAMPGIIIALIIYRRRQPPGQSNWAAYYGC